MADEGMTLPAIRRIIELETRLADLTGRLNQALRERDEALRRLAELKPGG